MAFEELIGDWDGEQVVVHHDRPTSAWMFIGVHSTLIGPAMGGTRLKSYGSPSEALDDVLRLSGAMTLKHAAADTPFGSAHSAGASSFTSRPAQAASASTAPGRA